MIVDQGQSVDIGLAVVEVSGSEEIVWVTVGVVLVVVVMTVVVVVVGKLVSLPYRLIYACTKKYVYIPIFSYPFLSFLFDTYALTRNPPLSLSHSHTDNEG